MNLNSHDADLKETITYLNNQQENELLNLREHFLVCCDNIKPIILSNKKVNHPALLIGSKKLFIAKNSATKEGFTATKPLGQNLLNRIRNGKQTSSH